MSDRLDDLATHVDDAVGSVEELENDPGATSPKNIERVKDALDQAKKTVDKMEDAEE
jgi:outer membrane murein-binding lipoprotein Lpp